jgi:hypothetical protein
MAPIVLWHIGGRAYPPSGKPHPDLVRVPKPNTDATNVRMPGYRPEGLYVVDFRAGHPSPRGMPPLHQPACAFRTRGERKVTAIGERAGAIGTSRMVASSTRLHARARDGNG